MLTGTSTNLKAGDGLLFPAASSSVCFGVVTSVATVPSGSVPGQGTTDATVTVLGSPQSVAAFPATPTAAALPQQVSDLTGQTIDAAALAAQAARESFSVPDLFACLALSAAAPQPVVALRTRAAIFGNTPRPSPRCRRTYPLPACLRLQQGLGRPRARTAAARPGPVRTWPRTRT